MIEALASVRLFAASLVVCSVVYPLIVLGFAKTAAPESSEGSLIRRPDGAVVGSRLLAQGFADPKYFWPRPSAVDYDAAAAGGSNLAPTNPKLAERARGILARYGLPAPRKLPAELATASGSGLDPHITLAGARAQVPRVAAARGSPPADLLSLVARLSEAVPFVTLEEARLVNVLELNLALDQTGRAE